MNAFEMELLIIPRVTPGSAFKNHIIFKLLWLAFYFQDILKKRNNPRGVVGGTQNWAFFTNFLSLKIHLRR